MDMFFTIVALGFVVGVLLLLCHVVFELSPFARRADHYRDLRTGERRWPNPNLEDRH
jgi:hypothetical protein